MSSDVGQSADVAVDLVADPSAAPKNCARPDDAMLSGQAEPLNGKPRSSRDPYTDERLIEIARLPEPAYRGAYKSVADERVRSKLRHFREQHRNAQRTLQ